MKPALRGERVALFEARLADEIAQLVRRSGGVPVCVPAVRERRRPASVDVAALLSDLDEEASPVFVFSTGVGASALFDEARKLGRAVELRDALSRGVCVCRGPKPVAALHREGITTSIRVRSPFTTAELLDALDPIPLSARMAVLVHYGERNEALVDALASRAVRLRELTLYQWELPEDVAPLERVVQELALGAFAAAAFTSQIQARHLMVVAGRMGRNAELMSALGSRVVVAAIGPTCARVLAEMGIAPDVVPETPKMGAMVNALVERLAEQRTQ